MPIDRYLKHQSFGPDEIKTIVAAFENALDTLDLVDRSDPLVDIVAKAVIEAAKHGMGTAKQIEQRALMVVGMAEPVPKHPAH
jgi:hypothetical protein